MKSAYVEVLESIYYSPKVVNDQLSMTLYKMAGSKIYYDTWFLIRNPIERQVINSVRNRVLDKAIGYFNDK